MHDEPAGGRSDRGGPAGPDHEHTGHYFQSEPDAASEPIVIDVSLPDTAFVLETDRGVFSRGRLDTGTAMLLRARVPLASAGDVLDLGCGAGPIALTMARRSPDATVWAVDVNRRALGLVERNAERNGLDNIRVSSPDDVPADIRFSTIWSNPPVRIGKGAMRGLLTDWLTRLGPEPASCAILVVQKHLGADSLQRWLERAGHPTERLASKAGYRLLRVSPIRDRPVAAPRLTVCTMPFTSEMDRSDPDRMPRTGRSSHRRTRRRTRRRTG